MATKRSREATFQELIDEGSLEIGDGYRAKNNELGGTGPIFLRAGHVSDTHIDFAGVERFHERLRDRLGQKFAVPGDTIVTTKGNSTGRTSFVTERMPEFVYSPHLSFWRSRNPKVICGGFLRYWSRGSEFIGQLQGMSASTDMAPYLSLTDQRRLRITLPSITRQERIADILGTLDDKIELNRRMNETLEAMARRLFKSWFVDFDPVHAKAALRREHPKLTNADLSRRALPNMAPEIAELFPDSFEDSTLGPIPKGWITGTVGDIGNNPRRGAKPDEIGPGTPYIALEHMPRRSISLSDWGHADDVASGKFRFNKGEILFGKLRPYFHKVGVPAVDGVCSTDVLVIVPTEPQWFGVLLGHASSDEMIAHTDTSSTGTKMPRTNWGDIARFEIAIPSKDIAKIALEQVSQLVDRIHANIFESRALAQTRDRLLPRLLSGHLPTGPSIRKQPT